MAGSFSIALRCGAAFLLVALVGCHDPSSERSRSTASAGAGRRRTTDGAIAVGNLEAEIAATERLAAGRTLTLAERAGQVDALIRRGQYLGRIADYERALAIAEALVRDAPTDGRAFVTRGYARATLHRFADASADLDAAERLGARGARTDGVRAAILQATGRYDEALAIRSRLAAAQPDILSIGAEASVRADRGEVDAALARFADAERAYRDVSPFPVAWLRFQEGAMWLREGDAERARGALEEAVERLPAYAPAANQLAQLDALEGRRDAAIARLRPLAERSDDPDYAGQLARILGQAGQPDEAARWRARAESRFDELLATYPEAFADHAADFFLNTGGDLARAVALAHENAERRGTPRAFELLLQSALAAEDARLACEAADGATRFPHRWPRLQDLVTRAYRTCGRWPGS